MHHDFALLLSEAFRLIALISLFAAASFVCGLFIAFSFRSLLSAPSPKPVDRSEPVKPSDYPTGGEGF